MMNYDVVLSTNSQAAASGQAVPVMRQEQAAAAVVLTASPT
jgi:hypothetical protein